MRELSDKNFLGEKGEEFVVSWLVKNGYKLLTKNYRCRGGEIDIVVQKSDVIAFVEVKRRMNNYFALSEVITKSKQQKIAFAAQNFINKHGISSYAFRFDVALVEGKCGSERITYIERAFRDERFSW